MRIREEVKKMFMLRRNGFVIVWCLLLGLPVDCLAVAVDDLGIIGEISPLARPEAYSQSISSYLNEGWEKGFFDGSNLTRNRAALRQAFGERRVPEC